MFYTQTGAIGKKLAIAAKLSCYNSQGKKSCKTSLTVCIVQNTCLPIDKHSSEKFSIPVGSQERLWLYLQVSRRCLLIVRDS